jgi:seryl-tRNA synthetase
MLSLYQLNQNKEHVLERLKIKGFDAKEKINSILELDELRKKTQKRLDDILAESNLLAKEIGLLYKTKEIEKANEVKKQTSILKEESKTLNQKLQETIDKIQEEIIEIPNIPHESVKAGKDETDNELIKTGDFNDKLLSDIKGTKPHWDVAAKARYHRF